MPFQSPRPRGRTRPSAASAAPRQCRFNPRVLAGGRDVCARHRKNLPAVSIPASSREDATLCPVCLFVAGHVSIPVPLQSRNLAISQSRNLAISQSRNNGLLAASGGGAESQNNGENLPGGDRNQRFAVGVRQEEASQCKKNAHAFFHLNATPKEH